MRDAGLDEDEADGRCTDDRSESSAELSDADTADDMPLAGAAATATAAAAAAVGVIACVWADEANDEDDDECSAERRRDSSAWRSVPMPDDEDADADNEDTFDAEADKVAAFALGPTALSLALKAIGSAGDGCRAVAAAVKVAEFDTTDDDPKSGRATLP